MAKLLLATAFALLAVASATDVYTAGYSSADCSGNPDSSSKATLDLCSFYDPDYRKVTLSGSTYSLAGYTDSSCTTSGTNLSPNPVTAGAADACAQFTFSGTARSAKVLSASDYASGAAATRDCTSGTCTTTSTNSAGTRSPVPLPCELRHAFLFQLTPLSESFLSALLSWLGGLCLHKSTTTPSRSTKHKLMEDSRQNRKLISTPHGSRIPSHAYACCDYLSDSQEQFRESCCRAVAEVPKH